MDHQRLAGIAECRLKPVWIPQVERYIVLRFRIQHPFRDMVKSLGRLAITFLDLGAQLPGPPAHRICLEQRVAPTSVDLPDLELAFLLEDPDEDRTLRCHTLL